jgi:hypothetical protein
MHLVLNQENASLNLARIANHSSPKHNGPIVYG